MNTVIYIRTSTLDQHPLNQLRQCISINKYNKPLVFQDQQSAWRDNVIRDNFTILLKLIKARKVSDLIVWDLDRLYRNRKKLIAFFKLCKLYKCKIHSARQQWLEEINQMPKPWDEIIYDLMLQIMGWLAEEESNKKSERVKSSIRKKNGVTVSYKGNKWGRKKIPQRVIDQVLILHKQGTSIRQIAKKVQYWDKNRNLKYISIGKVHEIVTNSVQE